MLHSYHLRPKKRGKNYKLILRWNLAMMGGLSTGFVWLVLHIRSSSLEVPLPPPAQPKKSDEAGKQVAFEG